MPERRRDPLDDRLRAALDRVSAPDLWRDAAAFALVVFAGSVAFLLGRGGTPTATSSPAVPTISTSMMLAKTPGIRCTASMPAAVDPGAPLGLAVTLTNETEASRKVSLFPPSYPVRVLDGDGTTWDTADVMDHSWPMVLPSPLAPGTSEAATLQPLPVQFPGPLTVTPTCAGETMPALHAAVAVPGSTPSAQDAVARAAAEASGLFDACMPPANGSVVGSIAPPGAADVSLPDVRCSAHVAGYTGFDVVTFVVTTPSAAPEPTVPPGLLSTIGLPDAQGNAETVVWRFVVTDADAYPVASTIHARTVPADAMETSYDVTAKGWSAGDTSGCGGEDIGWGGDGSSVTVVFFDACH